MASLQAHNENFTDKQEREMKRLDAELAKKTSDLNSMIMELTGRVKSCEEDIAEGPDEIHGQEVDDNGLSSMRNPDVGKSVHGELQSGDDDDGVNIGEDMKNSISKKASDIASVESPHSKMDATKASNEMLIVNPISVASKGSLEPQKESPTRGKKSTRKLPQSS